MKRFVDTDIWDKSWFMSLSSKHKLLIQFIFAKCDNSGVWQPNWILASAYIGEQVSKSDVQILSTQLEILENGNVFIPDFVFFQNGELSEKCPPHKKIFFLLKKHGLYERVLLGYQKGIVTLQDKDIEKEEDKEQEKEEDKITKAPKKKEPIKILFSDCEYYDLPKFIAAYSGTDYENYNLPYYYECVKSWSAEGNKKSDWIATARNFMLRDFKENKAVFKNGTGQTNNNNRSGQRTSQTDAYAADLARRIRENQGDG